MDDFVAPLNPPSIGDPKLETMKEQPTNKIETEKKNDDAVFCMPIEPVAPPSSKTDTITNVTAKTKPVKALPEKSLPKLDYTKPEWSRQPPDATGESEQDEEGFCNHYYLEVIKNGTVLEKIVLNKEFVSLGRLGDILCEHPSLSRFHAILQYSDGQIDTKYPQGFYMFDLNSTHGTIINKTKISPNQYVPIKNESMFKLGLSTRIYILHGPKLLNNSDDLQINLTHEQMKKIKEKYSRIALKLKVRKELDEEEEEKEKTKKEIDWGMKDELESGSVCDEEEEGEGQKQKENPFAVIEEEDESFYSGDPKKALANYFNREGDELFYDVEELGPGKFSCRIRLPITNNLGESIYAEAAHDGKKKECMALCALEACRILNAEGVLKQSRQEVAKRKKEKDWESQDYYDSDEDQFYDRTGELEKKRLQRMAKVGKLDEATANKLNVGSSRKVLTFEIILDDIKTLVNEKKEIEKKLDQCKDVSKAIADDDVDSYIKSLKLGNQIDTITRAKLRRRLVEIKNELLKLDKLLNVAKPPSFDVLKWKADLEKEIVFIPQETKKLDETVVLAEKKKDSEINKQLIPKVTETNEKNSDVNDMESLETIKNSKRISNTESTNSITNESSNETENVPTKKSNHRIKDQKAKNEEISSSKSKKSKINHSEEEILDIKNDEYVLNTKDYAVWMPPEGQSGDGKTKLNEKFGY